MKSNKLEKLIAKYVTNSITGPEMDHLSSWSVTTEDSKVFEDFVRSNYAANHIMGNYDTDKAKKQLLKKIEEDKKSLFRLKILSIVKYAAMAILLLGLGYLYKNGVFDSSNREEQTSPKNNAITLMLEDGSLMEVVEEGSAPLVNANGENVGRILNGKLDYDKFITSSEKYIYNTLSVPYGKRSQLILSDGTKIHLNSGSSVRYPIAFMKNGKRQVFLDGEAFFDVAKDRERPFIVNSRELNIQVLGTRFNVSSYSDDDSTNTVLVEGAVRLFKKGVEYSLENASLLEPGYKATLEKTRKEIVFEKVDTEIYTGWVQGKIIFNRMPFKDILKKLERHYNVEIINNNKQLDEEIFTASFDTETITEVLAAFNMNYPINYKKVENKIIIN